MSNVELEENSGNVNSPFEIDQVDFNHSNEDKEEQTASQSVAQQYRQVDNDESQLSTTDICRICHMGSFPPITVPHPMWEWPKQTATRVDSQLSTLSSYSYLGPLISVCKCRGTVALVHVECLERWLTESGHTRCELCGYRYLTKRVPRHGLAQSAWIWFNTVIATRQMLLDILYLVVTTPLALFSIYICALALRMILDSGFYEIPWLIVAMLPTCSLTLVAYWSWIITLGRLHGRRWRRFWRNNFVVRLLPDNPNSSSEGNNDRVDGEHSTVALEEEELFENQQEELEDFLQLTF
ncbi:hypothetical protein PV327_001432 [Microctonus hyperodae]|uniref:RING-CH-type domain-containing protein n=1 Tax=Microctonus hyperodae TaxID=165561 RepID=A0AA39L367_MICHY|nr:hypothetical protein PV327_001432 [Microctonus hyperodae]